MKVFLSEASKTIFITEVRTGSMNLDALSKLGVLKVLGYRFENNIKLAELCDLIKTEYANHKVYLCIRDPLIRRESALNMLSTQNYSQATYSENVSYFRGMINETLKHQVRHSNLGFLDYTLNDPHVDWGTSCYYHILVVNGIIPELLFLSNKSMFVMPTFISNDTDAGMSDYHRVLNQIIIESGCQEAIERMQKEDEKVNARNESLPDLLYINLHPNTLARKSTYQYYYNIFDSVTHCRYFDAWRDWTQSDDPQPEPLPFVSWIIMEAKMYQWAARLNSLRDHDLARASSKHLLNETLTTYAKYYRFHEVFSADQRGELVSYPGRKFLRFFDADYLQNFLTNT